MFDSVSDFLAMGGYGSYVWASYGLCFGGMAILLAQSILRWRKRRMELTQLEASRARLSTKAADSQPNDERKRPHE
jgi:heme exporter protein D